MKEEEDRGLGKGKEAFNKYLLHMSILLQHDIQLHLLSPNSIVSIIIILLQELEDILLLSSPW